MFGDFPSRMPLRKKAEGKRVYRSVANPLWKPYMPTSWKWMRTSGKAKVFEYENNTGETTTISFTLPAWMRAYLQDGDGNRFPTGVLGDTKIMLEAGDVFTIGNRKTVSMSDAESDNTVSTTFPELEFTQDGKKYSLNWNSFSQDREIAEGSTGQGWGFPTTGHPTLGAASFYDSILELKWNRTLSPFWWLLLVGAAITGWLWYRKK